MKPHKATTIGSAIVASLVVFVTSAFADGFNPKLSPVPVIGESLICSSRLPSPANCTPGDSITIDWAVGVIRPGVYEYLYGIETNPSTDVASWEIDYAPDSGLISDGFVSGITFDTEAMSLFGLSLGSSEEKITGKPVNPTSVVPLVPNSSTDHVTWGFDDPVTGAHKLQSRMESSALYIISTRPPTFGSGGGSDSGHGGSPWSTDASGSNLVPVPDATSAEPAGMILLGSAMFALAALFRQRRLR